jgi:hypothetical protein
MTKTWDDIRAFRYMRHALTSSAMASGVSGTVRPSAGATSLGGADGYRSTCPAGRRSLPDRCVRALPDRVVTVHSRDRGFAAGGRVVEIERLEFVVSWRRDREVRVGPAVRRR